jgi:hypothetical protein
VVRWVVGDEVPTSRYHVEYLYHSAPLFAVVENIAWPYPACRVATSIPGLSNRSRAAATSIQWLEPQLHVDMKRKDAFSNHVICYARLRF